MYPEPAMPGPGSALSVCNVNEEILYIYDRNSQNGNFGSVMMHAFNGNERIL